MNPFAKFYITLIPITFILFFLFILQHHINSSLIKPGININKQETAINFKKNLMPLYICGNKRMLSSLLWIKTLIESDIKHYSGSDLNSWIFHRIDTITSLDPDFYNAYYFGGQYLSIIKDDLRGAEFIYNKGIKQFPDDFWLKYHAAFNYYFEMGETKKAGKLYREIQHHPYARKKIPWLPSLVAKIEAEHGDLKNAFKLLQIAYKTAPPGPIKNKFDSGLYAIKAEIDLKCLNEKFDNQCMKTDFHNNPYIKNAFGTYIANEEWIPFRTSKRIPTAGTHENRHIHGN